MPGMTGDGHNCPDCSTPYASDDNYCRKCGMFVAALRSMTPADAHPAAPIIVTRPGLPAPMKRAATALVIGTALRIGLEITGRMLANQAARSVSSALTPGAKASKARPQPAAAPATSGRADSFSETLMIRRVWIRRDE